MEEQLQETAAQEPATDDASRGTTTEEEIARRAYEISLGDDSGTPEENWHRAERELRELRGGGS